MHTPLLILHTLCISFNEHSVHRSKVEEQFPDETSIYAEEGTAGHALAEHLIKKHLKIRSKRPTSDYYTDELIEAKKFDHTQFDRFCTNIYQEGYKNGKESVRGIETTAVMSAVKGIKGIGEKRLSQIGSAITQLMVGGELND